MATKIKTPIKKPIKTPIKKPIEIPPKTYLEKLFQNAAKAYLKLETKNRISDEELQELKMTLDVLWAFSSALPSWGIVELEVIRMREQVRGLIGRRNLNVMSSGIR